MNNSDVQQTQRSTPAESIAKSAVDWLGEYTISHESYTLVNAPSMSFAGEVLVSDFPWIEQREFTGGPRVVIRGTRIPVSTIVQYFLLGESIQTIQRDILPSLSTEQILDALRYFVQHKAEIAKELQENQEQEIRSKLAPFI